MIHNCPKCNAKLVNNPTLSKIKDYCPNCKGLVWKQQCFACNATYYSVSDDRNKGDWHNHQCDPKYIKGKETRRAAVEDRQTPTPNDAERLAYGNELLQDEE